MATVPTTQAAGYFPPPVFPGVVGQAPNAPGAVFFPEVPAYKHFATILFGVAGFFLFLALGVGITIGGPAWFFILLPPVFVVFAINRSMVQLHMDCICDASGLTLRQAKGKTPLPPMYVPWSQIQMTQCGRMVRTTVDSNSGAESTREYLTFQVFSPVSGAVRLEETRVQNLAGIIHMTNLNTPQLGYVWMPAAQAAQYQVLAKTGKYWQVRR